MMASYLVCLVYGIPRILCLFCFPFLLAGKHENIRGFQIVNAKELHIVFDKPMVVHADGEGLRRSGRYYVSLYSGGTADATFVIEYMIKYMHGCYNQSKREMTSTGGN